MPEQGAIGPKQEQSGGYPVPEFDEVVQMLAEGQLLVPAVLFQAQLSALARGTDVEQAIKQLEYRIYVAVVSPDPDVGDREVINTVAQGLSPLTGLLESLLEEIADLHERRKERNP